MVFEDGTFTCDAPEEPLTPAPCPAATSAPVQPPEGLVLPPGASSELEEVALELQKQNVELREAVARLSCENADLAERRVEVAFMGAAPTPPPTRGVEGCAGVLGRDGEPMTALRRIAFGELEAAAAAGRRERQGESRGTAKGGVGEGLSSEEHTLYVANVASVRFGAPLGPGTPAGGVHGVGAAVSPEAGPFEGLPPRISAAAYLED